MGESIASFTPDDGRFTLDVSRRALLVGAVALAAGAVAVHFVTSRGRTYGDITPALIGWDQSLYPLRIFKSSGVWQSDFDRNDYMPDADCEHWYYINTTTGSDAANGHQATPVKSIWKAIELGNASAFASYGMLVTAANDVPRANWFNNSGTLKPTKPIWVKSATGAAVRGGQFDVLSWADDGSGTDTYVATHSNVRRMVDPSAINAFGNYPEYLNVADQTAVQASAVNAWAQIGGSIYAKRADLAAVTNANARAYLAMNHFVPESSFYLENMHLEGGGDKGTGAAGGLVFINGLANVFGFAESSSFKYTGDSSVFLNNIDIKDSSGLFVFSNCDFGSPSKDGVGAHWYLGGEAETFILTQNCRGRDFGRGASTSNNPITGHENIPWIDINGVYNEGRGGVAFIGDSKLLLINPNVADDLGDGLRGTRGVVRTADNAITYVVDGSVSSSVEGISAFRADGNSRIFYRGTEIDGAISGNVSRF